MRQLMSQGRMTWAELGSLLGLSPPAAAERVRRLEEKGVIRGYTALVDPVSVGCGLTAFISVTLDRPEHRTTFIQRVRELGVVLECHHVTGEDDYLLKLRCSGIPELEAAVSDHIKGIPGVAKTRTTVVLSTEKETTALPLLPG
ncbi:MAG: Lrp/AsnC family transcriptional regulator, partial [Desulfocucumaceae bacterium]